MALKYNEKTLKRLESFFKKQGIQIRYGKGNFSSGYCHLRDKNIIVINKFFSPEIRINCLIDILDKIHVNEDQLTPMERQLFEEIMLEKAPA